MNIACINYGVVSLSSIPLCMCIKEVFDMISEKEITRHTKNNCYVSTLKTVLCSTNAPLLTEKF